jgi:predicted dehydrogenase
MPAHDRRLRLGLIGAGSIGRRHAAAIAADPGLALAAVVDPTDPGGEVAKEHGAAHHRELADLLGQPAVDGVVLATPNQLHGPLGLACLEAGLPLLVEKPIADSFEAGAALVRAAEARGLPLLVGHHRRHSAMVEATHALLGGGALGALVAVSALWGVRKPDDYFALAWRREPGGGPVLLNLIHDIDLLRHFAGEIAEVQAITSNAQRGHAVEDTAVALLRFASGALGTVTVTDSAPSPWGWEAGSNDNPGIAPSGRNCYHFFGTEGSLEFPNLVLWRHERADGNWREPLQASPRPIRQNDALAAQIRHFGRVIRGEEAPRVSGREGLATLAATLAVKESAHLGRPVRPRALD